jgi:hypothetical protein
MNMETELSVNDGCANVGRVVQRGDTRWEAFARDGLPLGLFGRQQSAIEAVFYHHERKCVGCDG